MATDVPGPLRVLHLVGSAVDEFYTDLSRLYAAGCLAGVADPARYDHHVAYVTPDGRWRLPRGLDPDDLAAAPPLTLPDAVGRIAALAPDVAVPQMFCRPGMTTYRGLLDLLAIPYLGNPPDVMALGADKAKARAVVAAAGVDVPPGQVVRPGEPVGVAPPAVVKPVDADNSFGVTLVREAAGYPAALEEAFRHSPAALVETYVELGREVRCGLVERDGGLVALPLEEYRVDAVRKPIRGLDDKVRRGADGGLELVAKDAEHAWLVPTPAAGPADPVTERVWAAARLCHQAMGCRHYSLFDFRVDPAGRPWFLEAGLYNSFSPQSVLTVMAAATGVCLPDLFAGMVTRALPDVATDVNSL